MMNNQELKGILPINKPQGWTSFDVVNKIKHIISVRGLKIGHLGTLDPMATGVLLVTIGKATKLFDIMQEKSKLYRATFQFGIETDSLDATGVKISENNKIVTLNEIEAVLPKFCGEINQVPPKFSAKSVNGKRAYDLARNNAEFELKANKIKVNYFRTVNFENNVWTVDIMCGSGTYIRALGRDIAHELDTVATMTSLVRTQIDNFRLENCEEIGEISKDNISQKIVKIKDILLLPTLELEDDLRFKILNGQTLKIEKPNGAYLLNDELDTLAIIQIKDFNAKMSIFLA